MFSVKVCKYRSVEGEFLALWLNAHMAEYWWLLKRDSEGSPLFPPAQSKLDGVCVVWMGRSWSSVLILTSLSYAWHNRIWAVILYYTAYKNGAMNNRKNPRCCHCSRHVCFCSSSYFPGFFAVWNCRGAWKDGVSLHEVLRYSKS